MSFWSVVHTIQPMVTTLNVLLAFLPSVMVIVLTCVFICHETLYFLFNVQLLFNNPAQLISISIMTVNANHNNGYG